MEGEAQVKRDSCFLRDSGDSSDPQSWEGVPLWGIGPQ